MNQSTIEYGQVKVGDYIYDHGYFAKNKWREVTEVKTEGSTSTLKLGVSARATTDTRTIYADHKSAAITVRRESESHE